MTDKKSDYVPKISPELAKEVSEAMSKKVPKHDGPRITINGVGITQVEINREAQYHPADNLFKAKKMAEQALAIRELLLQEALAQGLCDERPAVKEEEDIIEELLKQQISIPVPDDETCARYFKQNRKKFKTSALYEVSHILIPAPPNKKAERQKAKTMAQSLIEELKESPDRFDALAKEYSACSSAKEGGFMGQVSKGQTTPNFEAALFKMKKGETSAEPVETRFGYHVIKVHEYAEGKDLEYDAVKDWIADYLRQGSWQQAVSQYIKILAGKAEITGIDLKGADSPLVQ